MLEAKAKARFTKIAGSALIISSLLLTSACADTDASVDEQSEVVEASESTEESPSADETLPRGSRGSLGCSVGPTHRSGTGDTS